MRAMRSPCAASRKVSRCVTAGSRNPSAPRAMMSVCASSWDGGRRWSRPTTSRATAWQGLPSAPWRWRVLPQKTNMSASRTHRCLRVISPISICSIEAWRRPLSLSGVSKSGSAAASSGIGAMVLVTSSGFHGSYLRSSQSISMTAISGEGTSMERDYDYTAAPHGADLDARERVGRSAGERAVARGGPRKVATCQVPVVYDPRVSGSLVGHLVGAINGASIARKTSFLKDKLGAQLFAGNIRIIDDPLRPRGLRSQPFDAEGVSVKKIALVDQGVLTTWLLDCATARELGLATTGHAHRGVSSPPSPGATNLHLEAGPQTPEQLIADIADGFYVTELIGMGVNGVTGDYSRGASGFWIENGRQTYPVSEVTIAGHLLEIFTSMTAANDLKFIYGINAPTVRIEGLTLGGR